ncbi:MAG TPA: four helix bundle protein [Candidatus Polarisedimenticolaceae bacterium]|nr:four helix bundle protein [Candidatus Polarisedimenticolaceae bacterium]
MDAVGEQGARRVRAFRATDQFALAVWQAVRGFARPEGESLAREIRTAIARSGGALVAAASAPEGDARGRRALEDAHQGLLEIRYFLYLARRLGCLDLKAYKQLAALQEAALRELAQLLG